MFKNLWFIEGGMIHPPQFLSGCNCKNYIDAVILLLFYFSSKCALVLLVSFFGHIPLGSQAMGCQVLENRKWLPVVIQVALQKSFINNRGQYKWIIHNLWAQTKIWEAMAKKLKFNFCYGCWEVSWIFWVCFQYHLNVYIVGDTW